MRRILSNVFCLTLPLLCRSADIKHDPPTYRPSASSSAFEARVKDFTLWVADHCQCPLRLSNKNEPMLELTSLPSSSGPDDDESLSKEN